MLDVVSIFSKSGAVLWTQAWAQLKGDPINSVIHAVLLEVRHEPHHSRPARSCALAR